MEREDALPRSAQIMRLPRRAAAGSIVRFGPGPRTRPPPSSSLAPNGHLSRDSRIDNAPRSSVDGGWPAGVAGCALAGERGEVAPETVSGAGFASGMRGHECVVSCGRYRAH
ncbi:hypothetical protein [Burkholderia perseverans]|uniref:hypothetical protein n=1 Tax=Burkholderia perseverans TaxID=2615214 RepID=UPI001FEECECE|nr:hypothetical protein [Burkholderia perseverans]